MQPTRLLCPWDSPGKNTGVGLSCPFPGDLPDPGIEPMSPALQADSLLSEPPGKPCLSVHYANSSSCLFSVIFCTDFFLKKSLKETQAFPTLPSEQGALLHGLRLSVPGAGPRAAGQWAGHGCCGGSQASAVFSGERGNEAQSSQLLW